MIKGTQISGAGCEGGRRSGKHWSWILIKSLNVWRLDSLSPPDSNNLPHFLGASLSSSASPPCISTALPAPSLSPPQTSCHLHQTEPSLMGSADVFFFFPFVESFLLALTLSHCFAEGPAFQEPPTASRSAQPEHLAALSDLYFQLFGGFRALPSTTDRKWGARRLSAQPQTLNAEDTAALSGPTAFACMCVGGVWFQTVHIQRTSYQECDVFS